MKAILYCRVSSEEQAKGFSLQTQEKEGFEYARKNNIKIVKLFKIAESAAEQGRKSFNEAMRYLKQNSDVTVMLVSKNDRAARNFQDMALIDDLIKNYDKQIHFFLEGWTYDKNSSIGDVYRFGFMGVVSTGFSRNLSIITKAGLLRKAENGQFPGHAPFGYKNNLRTRMIEVDELQAPWVRRIKELAAKGVSIDRIWSILPKEGCIYKLHRSKIERIIRSPFYNGFFDYNSKIYQGVHQPLVSRNLHEAAIRGLERLNKPKMKSQHIAYRGLITCGVCGCLVTAERRKGRYVYYHCTWKRDTPDSKCDNIEYSRQEDLEEQFEKILSSIRIDEERARSIVEILEKKAGEQMVEKQTKIVLLKQERQRVKSWLDKAYVDKLEDKLDESEWLRKRKEWQEMLLNLETQIKELESLNPAESLATLKRTLELSNRLVFHFKSLKEDQRAELMKFVTLELKLKHKSLSVIYRKPFDLFAETVVSQNWGG